MTKVYAFKNSFFVSRTDLHKRVFLDSAGVEAEHTEFPTPHYACFEGDYAVHSLKSKKVQNPVQRYEPIAEFKDFNVLSEVEYSSLPDSFKKKYKAVKGETITSYEEVEVEPIVFDTVFDEHVFKGENLSKIREIVENTKKKNSYWRSSPKIGSFKNFESTNLTKENIIPVIQNVVESLSKASETNPAAVRLDFPSYANEHFNIKFYSQFYKGETKQVLLKKQNGRPYADKRSRTVPDLPSVVSEAKVTNKELMDWWDSIEGNKLSDNDKWDKLENMLIALRAGEI